MPARQRKRAEAPVDEPAREHDAEADEADDDVRDTQADEAEDDDAPDTGKKNARRKSRRRSSPPEISATEAARIGVREVTELTSKEALGVTLIERSEEGWRVGVEVLEDRRIPSASDVLAEYEAEIDLEGTLLFVRRTQRYQRGRGEAMGGKA